MEWLVIGLGNPGPRYENTRHNLGFMAIDELARRIGARVDRTECDALIGRGRIGESLVELAKPQTFMNLSGNAVRCLTAKDSRMTSGLIVISDDLALPLGKLRIRPKGSHGGQNGLRSIIERLGSDEFIRIRIGMAPEHPVNDASNFVLGSFAKGEMETVAESIVDAADAVEKLVIDGIEAAMAKFN